MMAGRVCQREVHLEDWVISCRAFSRRVEYRCLASLFERFKKDAVRIAFRPTPRNGPAQDLLRKFFNGLPSDGGDSLVLTCVDFEKLRPKLYDQVRDAS